ncbi:MAG: hypothetical protein FJ028_01485 [Chloroflexi bacterium]|nr:hypothetical protein [Chloroflexota bacterium]
MGDVRALIDEARGLGLFRAHAPFEVHCGNCHMRLDPRGDCPSCGIIGRPEADVAKRAQSDAAGAEKLLRTQIARRRAYKPVRAGAREG